MADWRQRGVLVREDEPAVWVLRQDYEAPDGRRRTRTGVLARVRVDEYGPGRIRPHERTHPGPEGGPPQAHARHAHQPVPHLQPVPRPRRRAPGRAMEQIAAGEPFASAADLDGTDNTLWRSGDEDLVAELQMALADAELLIADGHHRYETARVYADEVGGEGEHRYVLMLLCSLSDPGLLVFPTHRLLTGLKDDTAKQLAIRDVLHARLRGRGAGRRRASSSRRPTAAVAFGYMDSFHKQALPRHAQGPVDRRPRARGDARALPPARHRRARGARAARRAGHVRGRHLAPARARLLEGPRRRDRRRARPAAPTPASSCAPRRSTQVREVAEAGESMPPKSTYFYPKVPTGLVFNPLT